MRIAVLGPGGVGGLLSGLLERSGNEVTVVATESTAAIIQERGIAISSVTFGDFVSRPTAVTCLQDPVEALIVATKWSGLEPALERVAIQPPMILPQLNGLDHIGVLRRRFGDEPVVAGSIRVEADRPEPGVVVHTSPFLLVSMASSHPSMAGQIERLAGALTEAGVSTKVSGSEAQVMWSKLVRLNALACTTSAHDKLLGEIRETPELRAELVGAIEEASAVAQAEGAEDVDADRATAELDGAHATLGSSMQRDIAAGRMPELDAIPGSVLRAAARHGIPCPTIERLVAEIVRRAGIVPPVV